MKKLLLVLLVVTLASFLFVGCLPVTPAEGEGEGEGEAEICPTVSVTSQAAVGGKTYIKAGKQTITVTFAVPTEPVSVYVGWDLRPNGFPGEEVVMYPNADKTIYTGEFKFGDVYEGCNEAYIYVETCETCDYCKYPYTVDPHDPYVVLEVAVSGEFEDCPCGGCAMTISSVVEEDVCDPDVVCCGDDCSGLASWSFRLFDEYPWNVCCDAGCEDPIFEDSGTDCPIEFTTDCLDEGIYYAILDLVDNVGNETNAAGAFELYRDGESCWLGWAELNLPEACDYDDFYWCWPDDNPIVIIDPDETMDEDCYICGYQQKSRFIVWKKRGTMCPFFNHYMFL